MGGRDPIALLADALDDLEKAIDFNKGKAADTHTVVAINGLSKPEVPVALGRYLVGALAGAVELDAKLSSQLLAYGPDGHAEIQSTVTALVGTTNVFTTDGEIRFRDTKRNAWIGEGVGHALLALSARQETSCTDGQVVTLKRVHPTATRQGLDSVSTYVKAGVLGIAIGESKSTQKYASGNLGEAIGLFVKLENGVYEQDLRDAVMSFRYVLSDDLKPQVSQELWKTNAAYLPMIVHETAYNFATSRPILASLRQPLERRRIIVVQLDDFHAFFDRVADAMRAAVDEVVI
ncbi:hypothetical protein Cs7R123_63860 [Catellatospora sp. TT07R-123]|uniref:hypothetical protein n=1 Tax=Catellatospora sp. TT07R-123 TaxID=2733863 RepID=UPI001AFE450B|nr:hypothetical protein [Catellatospora sp. TT07R-123]GHJ49044.1 hypothetical protein Cs7R123_63860 [Catellatospora sp. TT07R-123]